MAELVIVDAGQMAAAGADLIEAQARQAMVARGRFDVALSGGGTPRPIYEALAARPLLWSKVHVWFGDERCVPPDHPESNYLMAHRALLARVPAVVHRMPAERADRDAAAADYAAELPEVLDLIHLGMGEDLHTASLFPGRVVPPGKRVFLVTDAPKPPPERLTIAPAVIDAARALLVTVAGAGKAAQVAQALEGPPDPERFPIHRARRGTWLIDRAAASKLKEGTHG